MYKWKPKWLWCHWLRWLHISQEDTELVQMGKKAAAVHLQSALNVIVSIRGTVAISMCH